MNRLIGLDFETETDKYGNCKPLIVCLNGKEYEKYYELDKNEGCFNFFREILTNGDKYVVFNASFDVEIIITYMLKMGFRFMREKDEPKHKTMKLLMGQKIYQFKTYFQYEGKLIESIYVDLGNLIVGKSLSEIANKFTPFEKGDYEVSKENREEFIKYCMLDAKITRVAYEEITRRLGREYLTIGGASFDLMLKMNFEGNKNIRMKKFLDIFGKSTIEEDEKLRKWYAGGFGWCSTDERTEVNIHSYDRKSAYPHDSLGKLPTKKGMIRCKGYQPPDKEYPFAFIHMIVSGQVKENHAPILPSRNIYGDSNIYIYDDKEVFIIQEYGKKSEYEFFMENIEIEDLHYIETYLMKEAKTNPLEKFMLYYYEKKNNSVGIERDLAKRIINSLTGKLGTNPNKENISYKLDENDKLIRDEVEEVKIEPYCTHVVSVITSRARCECYKIDEIIRDKVSFRLYATDSVKYESVGKFIREGNGIGEWEMEYENVDFIFLGLKAYIFDPYNKKGKRTVMCAGISKKYKPLIKNEDFYGSTMVKSLISVRSGNGRVIYEGYKRIATPVKKPRRR